MKQGLHINQWGTSVWYLNGDLHREDGPAIITKDGYQEWWINGQRYTQQEFQNYLIKQNLNLLL